LGKKIPDHPLDSTKEASRSGPWTTVLEANLTKGLEFLFAKKDGEHVGAMKQHTGCLYKGFYYPVNIGIISSHYKDPVIKQPVFHGK